MYTWLYLKWIPNKVILNSTGNSAQCYVAAWMGGEFEGEWTHVHVWLSPFPVHLKPSQCCLLTQSEKVGLKLSIQKTKIMASGPITSWEIDGGTVEAVSDFNFGGLQNN